MWRVPADTGRRYAAVSGDRNPIHLHPLPARLLGQPGAIAHGMWTHARCLAALAGRLPDAFTVEVAFKRPVRLPADVAFATWRDELERRFALHDPRSGAPHLDGRGQRFGVTGRCDLIRCSAAESAISVSSRRSRVSGRLALTTHHVAIAR